MAFALGTPHPSGSSTSSPALSGTFIPEVWSGKLLHKFYSSTVLAAISNTDYEGEIRNFGDKVKIRQVPDVTINTYAAEQTLAFQRPSVAVIELDIDQGKYFNCILDDVLAQQSDIELLDMWAEDAAEQMKISIDTDILAGLPAATAAANAGTTAGAISGDVDLGAVDSSVELVGRSAAAGETEVLDMIVDMGQVLDEQNVPESGRWLVLPSWACSMVQKSDLRQADISGDDVSLLRNGRLGMIDRFTIYRSNLLPTAANTTGGDGTYFLGGHSVGLTFASQLAEMETLRMESTFGNVVRGLQVYGYKVTDGTALVTGFARKSEV